MKTAAIFTTILFVQSIVFGQPQKNEKIHFTNISQIGFLVADHNNNCRLESINGIKYKKWSLGIGAGIDWQAARSVPLFLDLRKHFGHQKNDWFIYGDAGGNFWWEKNKNAFINDGTYLNTFFAEAGFGYSIQLKARTKLLFSVGYGNKETDYKTSFVIIRNFPPYTDSFTSYSRISTYINNLVFKMGIQF